MKEKHARRILPYLEQAPCPWGGRGVGREDEGLPRVFSDQTFGGKQVGGAVWRCRWPPGLGESALTDMRRVPVWP